MSLPIEKLEETIYQITRAVYARLGETADRKLVEGLVNDIFSALHPLLTNDNFQSIPPTGSDETQAISQRCIVSVFGVDRPGIVAAVATLLGETNCNIIDMNQTVVQGKFAMIMIIDAARSTRDITQLREIFREAGSRLGVRIYLQREDIFHAMHRV
jgi:ACT domain-containing protein